MVSTSSCPCAKLESVICKIKPLVKTVFIRGNDYKKHHLVDEGREECPLLVQRVVLEAQRKPGSGLTELQGSEWWEMHGGLQSFILRMEGQLSVKQYSPCRALTLGAAES